MQRIDASQNDFWSSIARCISTALVGKGWIVGGALRDSLLGRAGRDIDLAIEGDPEVVANALADECGGSIGHLDTSDVARVSWPGYSLQIDIARLKAETIEGDLRARDFTINAMALPWHGAALVALLEGRPLHLDDMIDPFQGRVHLAESVLHLVTPGALLASPQRILRAARLASARNLRLGDDVVAGAGANAQRLVDVPPEIIVQEFYTAFAVPFTGTRFMRLLDECRALTTLLPEYIPCRGLTQGRLHHWDVFTHSLEVIDAIDLLVERLQSWEDGERSDQPLPDTDRIPHPKAINLAGYNGALIDRLNEVVTDGQTRRVMLKMGAVFHDLGKPATIVDNGDGTHRFPYHAEAGVPITQAITHRWKMGRRSRGYLETLVLCHMQPGQMAALRQPGLDVIRQFFRSAGDIALDVLLFSLADHFAVYGPDPLTRFWYVHEHLVADLAQRYYEDRSSVMPPSLLDGHDLIDHFGDIPGKELGVLLAAVDAALIENRIATRADAIQLVEELRHTSLAHDS